MTDFSQILPYIAIQHNNHKAPDYIDPYSKPKYKLPEAHRKKTSDTMKGRTFSPEHLQHLKDAARKPETREAARQRRLGVKVSDITKAKLSLCKTGNTYMLGKHHTDKTKQKMSEARLGIKLSDVTKARISAVQIGKHVGDKNPSWKGGTSFYPYCQKFTREFKERVRKFFNYTCMGCRKSQDQFKRKLDIHHVNYDKMVCCNNLKPLFVPLCRSCHSKTRWDSNHFEQKYTDIINNEFCGKCYLEKA